MTLSDIRPADVRPQLDVSDVEWETRQKLAACYRIVDHLGWTSLIANHISVRIPETDDLLINPFGLLYSEVRASNLVRIDLDGNIVGESAYPVNPAGIVIHTAIHRARPDVASVLHTHTLAGSAVAGLAAGLDHNSFIGSILVGRIAYHDFEGPTLWDDEKERLVANLGDKWHLVLRNHGLLTCGTSIPEVLLNMIQLEEACRVQVATMSLGQPLQRVSDEALRRAAEAGAKSGGSGYIADLYFDALEREVLAKDPSFRA